MWSRTFGFGLFVFLLAALPAHAQGVDPRFPEVGKNIFGVYGFYVPESTAPIVVGLNPATLNSLLDFQSPPQAELDFGQLRLRSNLVLDEGIFNYSTRLGKRSSARFSLYQTWTNRAPTPFAAPASVRHSGTGFEMVYAYRVTPQLDLGVAVVPIDVMDTTLYGNQRIAKGTARSAYEGRVGGLWHNGKMRIGAAYEVEQNDVSAKSRGGSTQDSVFHASGFTGGISYEPRLGTSLFYNYQKYWLGGEGVSTARPLPFWGVRQFLSPQWMVGVARVGAGTALSAGYIGKKVEVTLSCTDRAFSASEDVYGKGTLVFASVVGKF